MDFLPKGDNCAHSLAENRCCTFLTKTFLKPNDATRCSSSVDAGNEVDEVMARCPLTVVCFCRLSECAYGEETVLVRACSRSAPPQDAHRTVAGDDILVLFVRPK